MSIQPQTASAAVAIIKSLNPQESFLILRRATHPDDPWSGHFSFPGGRKEDKDQDLLSTCIRETKEETGILLEADFLKQRLPLEPAGQNLQNPLWVQPFLFTIRNHPPLVLSQQEIQSACWLDAQQFQNIELHTKVEMVPGHIFPAFPLQDYYLWGFTYRLLRKILQMQGSEQKTDSLSAQPG
jgi:8-oxo-dGTP pyrophosphatase MutT (NUDIX family)